MIVLASLFLASLPPWVNEEPQWIVAGAVVLLGLLVYGFKDVIHFSAKRVWAISGVCFAESIRRRVLWIIPLAILGVIIVAQLQHPADEQDAIRETTKFCLFATGLVVTITAIILACTNLPKEIDNRVIYTIVTKPTTRLEIVLGKIVGFARVSATILLIMGIFTMGYMQLRSLSLEAAIDQRLKDGSADIPTTAMLTHYKEAGLLNARTYARAGKMEILARPARPGDQLKWMYGGEGNFIVPFQLTAADLIPANDPNQDPGSAGLAIVAHVGFQPSDFGPPLPKPAAPASEPALPNTIAAPNAPKASASSQTPTVKPTISISILDQNQNNLIDSRSINGGKPIELTDPTGHALIIAMVTKLDAGALLKSNPVFVQIRGDTAKFEYSVGPEPVVMAVPLLNPDPNGAPLLDNRAHVIVPLPGAADPSHPAPPLLRTNVGLYGEQIRGGKEKIPVAVYQFRHVQTTPDRAGNIPFELRVGIERGTSQSERDLATVVQATIVNHSPSGEKEYPPVNVSPEINRTAFFTVPANEVDGGDFDVDLRCVTDGQFVGLKEVSLNLVVAEHSFALNLAKSLFVLWMMSVLVVIVSIFSSTFLSWPIAIVLTVLILLGHWGVSELGDSTAPGIGNLVATDMGLRDPSKMHVVSDSVEALAKMLNVLTKVLPDITQFSALEDIEQGISLPLSRLSDGLAVIGGFGVPLTVMAYIFLRNKEVAP
jgi:ABC-type transport system involved in multi-copper enzyme maturation permease subunit